MTFTKGYEAAREKVKAQPYYLMSCFNCNYYYQSAIDTEELCQNKDVLSFDIITRDGGSYCTYWKQVIARKKPKLFDAKERKGKLFNQ
jgi:hypothetical protein